LATRVPLPEPSTDAVAARRGSAAGVAQAAIWIAGILVYAALGAWQPAVFLLGFWQSFPFVLLVTWIAGRALAARIRRGRR
jgi:hypothetical protein